jgi:hypothetical protein
MTCQHNDPIDPIRLRYRLSAHRMVLAWLNNVGLDGHDSKQVFDLIATEIGNCPGCWRRIAEYLAGLSMEYLTGLIAVQDGCVDEGANAEKAATKTEERIAKGLD